MDKVPSSYQELSKERLALNSNVLALTRLALNSGEERYQTGGCIRQVIAIYSSYLTQFWSSS